jgi:hypothetical protein
MLFFFIFQDNYISFEGTLRYIGKMFPSKSESFIRTWLLAQLLPLAMKTKKLKRQHVSEVFLYLTIPMANCYNAAILIFRQIQSLHRD